MVACAMAELPSTSMTININITESSTNLEELQKLLERNIYERICCDFIKT